MLYQTKIMSPVANDNSVPTHIWLFKFLKIGIFIAIFVGLIFLFI